MTLLLALRNGAYVALRREVEWLADNWRDAHVSSGVLADIEAAVGRSVR